MYADEDFALCRAAGEDVRSEGENLDFAFFAGGVTADEFQTAA